MTSACSSIRELLDDALDLRLAPAAQTRFDEHVRSCAACSAEWELAISLRASLLRIGLDPAPAGLRESIAADVRRLAHRAPRVPAYARAAAAILVVVTVAWFGLRSREASPAPASNGAAPSGRADAVDKETSLIAKAHDASAAPRQITTGPAGLAWHVDRAAPMAAALSNAREILDAGPRGVEELSRIVQPGTTPEHRLRQAEFLVLLHANVGALTEAAGEAPALSQLARDADDTLLVFSDRGAGEKARSEAFEKKAPDDVARDSAMKVVPAPMAPAASSRLDAAAGREPAAGEPAFYMVSGPGAIGRVERVLTDRALRCQQVWLADQADNLRKRKLDEQATAYRIVEVQVPEAGMNDLIGDLESLAGLQLAPVGRGADLADRRAAQDTGAPEGQRKPLPNRKLRLVLIDR